MTYTKSTVEELKENSELGNYLIEGYLSKRGIWPFRSYRLYDEQDTNQLGLEVICSIKERKKLENIIKNGFRAEVSGELKVLIDSTYKYNYITLHEVDVIMDQ